jgi:hypothetical protein
MRRPPGPVLAGEPGEPIAEGSHFPQNSTSFAFHTWIAYGVTRVVINQDLLVPDKGLATIDHIQQPALGVCHFEKNPLPRICLLGRLTDVADTVQNGLDLGPLGRGHVRQNLMKRLRAV